MLRHEARRLGVLAGENQIQQFQMLLAALPGTFPVEHLPVVDEPAQPIKPFQSVDEEAVLAASTGR